MRPSRTSVAWECGADAALDRLGADSLREGWLFRIVVVFLMQGLCGNSQETTITRLRFSRRACCRSKKDLDDNPGRHNPQAHVDCLGRVGQLTD
jgi:hypothetical protein